MSKKKASQNSRLGAHLLEPGSITPAEAVSLFQCYRLSARIREIERGGWLNGTGKEIIHRREPNLNGGHHVRYYLQDIGDSVPAVEELLDGIDENYIN